MTSKIARSFVGVAFATVMSAFCTPAQAVFVSSGFEPLSFFGNGLFQLDQSCLNTPGSYTGSACHASFLNSTVDITDTANSDTFTVTINGPAPVTSLTTGGGNITSLVTGIIGYSFPSSCTGTNCTSDPYDSAPWWLEWTVVSGMQEVLLFTGSCYSDYYLKGEGWGGGGYGSKCSPNTRTPGISTHVTFERVPEPATLSLVALAAVLGVPLLRRRARRR